MPHHSHRSHHHALRAVEQQESPTLPEGVYGTPVCFDFFSLRCHKLTLFTVEVMDKDTLKSFDDATHEMMAERQTLHDLHVQERALRSALDFAEAEEDEAPGQFGSGSDVSDNDSLGSGRKRRSSSESSCSGEASVGLRKQLKEVQLQIQEHTLALKEDGKKRDKVMSRATGWKTQGTVGEEIAIDME